MNVTFPTWDRVIPFGTNPIILGIAAILLGLTVAAMPPAAVLGAVVVVAGLWSGAKRPDLALAMLAASIPIQTSVMLDLGFGMFTVTKVVVWTILLGWLWSEVKREGPLRVDPVTAALFLVTASLVFSGWNATDGGLWIGEVYRWLIAVPVALMAYSTYSRNWPVRPLVVATAIATLFCCTVATWQVVEDIGPPSFESRGLMRATGPFDHPNQLALYIETTTPLVISLGIFLIVRSGKTSSKQVHDWFPWLVVGSAFAGIVTLLLSQSRGGGAGMAAALVSIVILWTMFCRRPVTWIAGVGLAGFVVALAGVVLVLSSGIASVSARETLVSPANFAVEERLAHWVAGVRMALDNLTLGIGGGNFDRNFREATSSWRFRIGRGHAHNSGVHMLAQAGILGYASYLVLISVVGLTAARAVDTARNIANVRAVAIGVAGTTAAIVVHGLFEYVHVLSISLQLAILWGLASAIARNDNAHKLTIGTKIL